MCGIDPMYALHKTVRSKNHVAILFRDLLCPGLIVSYTRVHILLIHRFLADFTPQTTQFFRMYSSPKPLGWYSQSTLHCAQGISGRNDPNTSRYPPHQMRVPSSSKMGGLSEVIGAWCWTSEKCYPLCSSVSNNGWSARFKSINTNKEREQWALHTCFVSYLAWRHVLLYFKYGGNSVGSEVRAGGKSSRIASGEHWDTFEKGFMISD